MSGFVDLATRNLNLVKAKRLVEEKRVALAAAESNTGASQLRCEHAFTLLGETKLNAMRHSLIHFTTCSPNYRTSTFASMSAMTTRRRSTTFASMRSAV